VVEPALLNPEPTSKMSHQEADYYQRRAEAEIELAQQANHVRVVRAHYELASAYLDRIHGNAAASEETAHPA
jgi:predicted adenine nucleotide alpha hydrolase (AANH) superfamily ATPase